MIEGYIDGEYNKFMNNEIYANDDLEIQHLTAFSHYTYLRTNGKYMVTDL